MSETEIEDVTIGPVRTGPAPRKKNNIMQAIRDLKPGEWRQFSGPWESTIRASASRVGKETGNTYRTHRLSNREAVVTRLA